MKGEPHPTKNPIVRRTFLPMDDIVERIDSLAGVAASRDSNGVYVSASWVPYHKHYMI